MNQLVEYQIDEDDCALFQYGHLALGVTGSIDEPLHQRSYHLVNFMTCF